MEWIEILKWIATFIATASALIAFATKAFKGVSAELNKKIDDLSAELKKEIERLRRYDKERDIEHCRVELNTFLNRVEYHYDEVDEEEWQLYSSIYDRYTNELNQNSFIHTKWERVTAKRIKNGKGKS